jgi:hypothetical protein
MHHFSAMAQDQSNLACKETNLIRHFTHLRKSDNDSLRKIYNDSILACLHFVLQQKSATEKSYDSVPGLVTPASPDGKFRFFHWNIQWNDGHHSYYGFLCVRKASGESTIYPLNEQKAYSYNDDTKELTPSQWYGALYYKILPMGNSTPQDYTLLGWSGKDNYLTRKIIEVLTFSPEGRPIFGKAIFDNFPDSARTRVIFQYSAGATMTLRYENQVVSVKKIWNKKRREFDISEDRENVIVADRLVPMDPLMKDQYQFYIPSGDTQDAFLMKNGRWKFKEGIEPRNPE